RESPAHTPGSVPAHNHAIELKNLRLQYPQLGAKSRNTRTRNLGQSFVTCIDDDTEQLIDTITSDRCNDAKLRKMSTDRINHRGLLADEQMTGTMKRQA